jgi:hypothetical protein
MYPQFGFVDVARLFDQSVYGPIGQGISDQLSAMPSVHVAWSLWVAIVVIAAAHTRWRWLIVLHPMATVFAVVATANHWWADGIVAAFLLAFAIVADDVVRGLIRRTRAARTSAAGVQPEDADETVGANDGLVPALPMSTSSGSRRSST